MRFAASLLSVLLVLIFAPGFANDLPRPQKSPYLLSTGAGFLMQVGGEGASYGMTFQLRKRIRKPIHAVTIFENPMDTGQPFVVEEAVAAGQQEITPASPRFSAAENGRIYIVRVELYEDASKSKLLGQHAQGVQFFVPEELAPRMGVTLK